MAAMSDDGKVSRLTILQAVSFCLDLIEAGEPVMVENLLRELERRMLADQFGYNSTLMIDNSNWVH